MSLIRRRREQGDAANGERRFPVPPGARSGWEINSAYEAVATLAAFGGSLEAREGASMPEAWYRSNELIAEEASYAALRGLKACVVGDERAARDACNETIGSARNDAVREHAAAVLALVDGREHDFHRSLAAHVESYAKDRSRTRQHERLWLQVVALVLCRLARSRGIEVAEGWELPIRFIHPSTLL